MTGRELNEECGIIGLYNVPHASVLAYYALHSLQHRGEEGAGIVTREDNSEFHCVKNRGLASDIFKEKDLKALKGNYALGHVSYSGLFKRGGLENVQPLFFKHSTGDFAVAHNGNITNSDQLRYELEQQGSIFQSTSDSEIIAHLIKMNRTTNRAQALKEAVLKLEGAFAFAIMTQHGLYACRDRDGLRPLCIGKIGEDGYVIASESCAFEIIGATFVRDVLPGEMIYIRDGKLNSSFFVKPNTNKICAMEYIYFARPDSVMDGRSIYEVRKKAGEILYRENPTEADMVVGVPDSSLPAAAGYAKASGIPFELALLKNKYVGRTFILPDQQLRERGVLMKLSVIAPLVKGKRIVLVDDSIVRGTTSRRIVGMLKRAGAKEVHVRIASPTFLHPCYYGVDTETYDELIGHFRSVEEIRELIGADSLSYLSAEGLVESVGIPDICRACFTGEYPVPVKGKEVLPPVYEQKK